MKNLPNRVKTQQTATRVQKYFAHLFNTIQDTDELCKHYSRGDPLLSVLPPSPDKRWTIPLRSRDYARERLEIRAAPWVRSSEWLADL